MRAARQVAGPGGLPSGDVLVADPDAVEAPARARTPEVRPLPAVPNLEEQRLERVADQWNVSETIVNAIKCI